MYNYNYSMSKPTVSKPKVVASLVPVVAQGFYDAEGTYVPGAFTYPGYHPVYPFYATPDIVAEVNSYELPFKNVSFPYPPYNVTVLDKYETLGAQYPFGARLYG